MNGENQNIGDQAVVDVDVVVRETNALAIADPVRKALRQDLGPVADMLPVYQQKALAMRVSTQADAEAATGVCDEIAAAVKTVKGHEVLSRITDGLHKMHRRWTALRDALVMPLEESRRTLRTKVINWQEGERRRAEDEQRRLQAVADEKARREREALLKKAEAYKTPEKREAVLAQAETVVAPVVHVEAPTVTMRGVAKVWKVKSLDALKFLSAAAADPMLHGYIEIKLTNLERAKAANPSLNIDGVVFHQIVR